MQQQFIEVNQLEHSPRNARRSTARGSLEELKASILAHGLMQNLVVTAGEAGTYHVIAGGRRLEAIRALAAGRQAAGRLRRALPGRRRRPRAGNEPGRKHRAAGHAPGRRVRSLCPADRGRGKRRADRPALRHHGQACRAAAEAGQARPGADRRLPRRGNDARLPDGLYHHRRPRQAVAGVPVAASVAGRQPPRNPLAAHRRDGRSRRASWPASSGWTPTTRPAARRAPTCSASGSISKTPSCCTNWPPTSSTPPGRSWRPKAGAGSNAAPTATGASVYGCGRIHPQPVDAPPELLDRQAGHRSRAGSRSPLALEDSESDALIEAQEAAEAEHGRHRAAA